MPIAKYQTHPLFITCNLRIPRNNLGTSAKRPHEKCDITLLGMSKNVITILIRCQETQIADVNYILLRLIYL